MDFFGLFLGIIDFLKFLIPVSIIAFIFFKIFSRFKQKLIDRFDLSWVKSCLIINLSLIFVIIFCFYIYFIFVGASIAPITEPELSYNFFESLLMIGLALIRILVVTIILSLALLFFEFFSSIIIVFQKEKDYSDTLKELVGVFSSTAFFLFLLFFVFNWVPLGLFIYIFYGFVGELPMLASFINFGSFDFAQSIINMLNSIII